MPHPSGLDTSIDPGRTLAIVVGANPQSEAFDRPPAYKLREEILRWQRDRRVDEPIPLVCCDLWYVNDEALRAQPTLCIGSPEVNAATAWLGSRLPTAFVIENSLRVQLDVEFIDLRACIWGVDHSATSAGLGFFIERYLDSFLRHVHNLPAWSS